MVSEKPPRRSKAEKEPVTIDLAAEETEVVAEPVRSIDADEPVTSEERVAEASETPAGPQEAKSDIADERAATPSAAEAAPIAEDTEIPEEPRSATVAPEPEPSPAPRPPTGPAASTLVAAGIFGGIVALALTGSMQYAGYLPAATRAPTVDMAPISSELAELRQEVAALRDRPASPATDTALADRVTALEASANAPGSQVSEQALAALKTDVDTLRSAIESTAGNGLAVEERVKQIETRLNDRGPEQQIARAIAAAALKAAIDRGGSFETELQTFASVAGDDPAVADLQKFAASGVPSRAELQREFPRVADAMLEAVIQPDPNQGIVDRLLSSAMSVVKVRRVGDVEGDTPEAIVARLEEGLRNGDLQASAREWDALPEPAKAVSRDFRQKLDARIQVENLVGGTLTRAVAGTQG